MRANFVGGPYDGITLQIKEGLTSVVLPAYVSIPENFCKGEPPRFDCNTRYVMVKQNDIQAWFKFDRIM